MNAQILPQILQRYSPMAFSEKEISENDIRLLIEAARWSPSAYNEQPWRYVFAIKGSALYDEIHRCLVEYNRIWSIAAPVLVAVYASKTLSQNGRNNPTSSFDAGMATGIMIMQAMNKGIYCHAMGGYDHEALNSCLNSGETMESICIIAMGYPGNTDHLPEDMQKRNPHNRTRKTSNQIASINDASVLSL